MAYLVVDGATAAPPSRSNRPERSNSAPPGAPGQLRPLPVIATAGCPEIDCVRHLVSPATAVAAEQRAARLGVGADRVLIAGGHIAEETYVVELAAALGLAFEPLDDVSRSACPIDDGRLIETAITGLLPLSCDGETKIVMAPRLAESRRLIETMTSGSDLAERIRLTSPARLHRFVARHGAAEIGRRAVDALRERDPELSASPRRRLGAMAAAAAAAAAVIAGVLVSDIATLALELSLGATFVAWTGLRLAGIIAPRPISQHPRPCVEASLPVYTVVVALYREAAAAKDLVAALRRLNYPREKLDIKLVLEADDRDTREALDAMRLTAPFEIVTAPASGPRTKPKALNSALPFARGSFVAVFDAEDRPEPDQLRLALEAFTAGDRSLACVQARLTIDNSSDNWLTELFTAEYASLFDVLLPGLADWRLPLPLGGSSNHFRTSTLREIGAWDPYNVTEDADLGMRLARFGYRTAVIASTTYEEAPAAIGPWLKQRTRWFKGWLQTWLVHMRQPLRLWRQLGPRGFVVFQLLVGGTVLAAWVHVLFVIALLYGILAGIATGGQTGSAMMFHWSVLAIGYLASAMLGVIGLARRRLLGCAWALVLIPVYWMLLSAAAWRALIQLLHDPYRWEKTEHGLARTSRLVERSQSDAAVRGALPARPSAGPASA